MGIDAKLVDRCSIYRNPSAVTDPLEPNVTGWTVVGVGVRCLYLQSVGTSYVGLHPAIVVLAGLNLKRRDRVGSVTVDGVVDDRLFEIVRVSRRRGAGGLQVERALLKVVEPPEF